LTRNSFQPGVMKRARVARPTALAWFEMNGAGRRRVNEPGPGNGLKHVTDDSHADV